MKQKVSISKVKENENNPRFIKDFKFRKLVDSIKQFPEMLEKRPIVVDENFITLGGNMRLKACREAGLKEVWIDVAEGWTEEQKKEFVIKDNVNYGDWDYDILSQDYDIDMLIDFGVNVLYFGDDAEKIDKQEKDMIIKQMEIKFNEHHDYIVFLFDNVNDWVNAVSKLGIGKSPVSLSPKTKKIGLGRVIPATKLIDLLNKE